MALQTALQIAAAIRAARGIGQLGKGLGIGGRRGEKSGVKLGSSPLSTATRTIKGRTFPDTGPPDTQGRPGARFAGLTFRRPATNFPGQQRSGGYTMGTPSGDSATANTLELKRAFSKGGMSQEEYDARLKSIRMGIPEQWQRFHKPKTDTAAEAEGDAVDPEWASINTQWAAMSQVDRDLYEELEEDGWTMAQRMAYRKQVLASVGTGTGTQGTVSGTGTEVSASPMAGGQGLPGVPQLPSITRPQAPTPYQSRRYGNLNRYYNPRVYRG